MSLPRHLLAFAALFAVGLALDCHCTKDTETVKCVDKKCTTDGFCIMMDHPLHGRHYTCNVRGLNNDCITREARSGAQVEVCGCTDVDNCNLLNWPVKEGKVISDGSNHAAATGADPDSAAMGSHLIAMMLSVGLGFFFF
ncbi:unnamed protein product, partial [Mesorhabditis spiculigera]